MKKFLLVFMLVGSLLGEAKTNQTREQCKKVLDESLTYIEAAENFESFGDIEQMIDTSSLTDAEQESLNASIENVLHFMTSYACESDHQCQQAYVSRFMEVMRRAKKANNESKNKPEALMKQNKTLEFWEQRIIAVGNKIAQIEKNAQPKKSDAETCPNSPECCDDFAGQQ